jgi:hypothetical protein
MRVWDVDASMVILRSPIPMKLPVHKTVARVFALAKLHNYSIDENEARCEVAYSSAIDEWRNELTGAVPLVETTHQHTDASRTTDPTPVA